MSKACPPPHTANYPFSGELYLSRQKAFEEIVFFVHFYEGTKKQMMRHIRLVNNLGFDAFAFHLQGNMKDLLSGSLPWSAQANFGIKHTYADQIEALLNLLPQRKIVFSFSNPSASAIEAIARRYCSDIQALICDSGPSNRFLASAVRLYQQEYSPSPWQSYLFAPFMSLGWSPFMHLDLHDDLAQFPEDFPVLSISGWKDALIPPEHIDEVFEPHLQLKWQKLSLPGAEHLKGLRDFRDDYVPVVKKFLYEVATPL